MTGSDAPGRGRVVLVAVVLLAALLVGLALAVTAAMDSENRSTEPADADDALVQTSVTFETVDALLDRSNANPDATHAAASRNFTRMVDAVAVATRTGHASEGVDAHVALTARTTGTHVRHANDTRAFTDATGTEADWTVLEDARGVSDYRLTVHRDRLHTDTGDSLATVLEDSFAVHVANPEGATWTLHVYENTDGEVTVRTVRDGEVQAPCTAAAGTVAIDLVEGTVAGEPCSTLSFARGLAGALDIEYRNPGRSAGTYEFRVDRALTPETDTRYRARGDGSPSATPNVYAATVQVTYETADVSVTRTHRLVAGDQVYTAA